MNRQILSFTVVTVVAAAFGTLAQGAEVSAFPEGIGLAARYVGDKGIENHRTVVFTENFETGNFAEIVKRWGYTSIKNGEIQAFSGEVPPGSAGRRSTDFPGMKINQFLLTPYFGPGLLPHSQTLWIDEFEGLY